MSELSQWLNSWREAVPTGDEDAIGAVGYAVHLFDNEEDVRLAAREIVSSLQQTNDEAVVLAISRSLGDTLGAFDAASQEVLVEGLIGAMARGVDGPEHFIEEYCKGYFARGSAMARRTFVIGHINQLLGSASTADNGRLLLTKIKSRIEDI